MRRRLREIVRLSGHDGMQAGHDYVLIGRRDALDAPFARMAEEFHARAQARARRIQSG